MANKFHFYSWPLGKGFEFSEWCDYCRTHPSTHESVAEFGGFQFNVNGYCLNADRSKRVEIGGAYFEVGVYLAPQDKKLGAPLRWNYTISWDEGQGGGSGGCTEVEGDREDAVLAGLRACEEKFKRAAEWYGNHYPNRRDWCLSLARRVREEYENSCQLTLF